jgi:hypothetical protein
METEMLKGQVISLALVIVLLAPACTLAGNADFRTFAGWELSGQYSHYRYAEPDKMYEKGNKIGLAVKYTDLLQDDKFLSAGIRLATGKNTYVGSGTLYGIPDTLLEWRIVEGDDFVFDEFSLSPYAGLGYRVLYNDTRGVTSTGARGYRRLSQYLYIPIGLTHRIALDDNPSRIATTLEYDLFLSGRQRSYLSDTGLGYPDMSNDQRGGHGLKASIAYEVPHWSFGVFADYWKITMSDPAYFYGGGGTILFAGWEPDNNTHESGIFVKYRF